MSPWARRDRKSTRLNSSHLVISYAVFCLKKKNEAERQSTVPPDAAVAPSAPRWAASRFVSAVCVGPDSTVGRVVALFFFFNDTATTEIYTLSLHDALPIC